MNVFMQLNLLTSYLFVFIYFSLLLVHTITYYNYYLISLIYYDHYYVIFRNLIIFSNSDF